MGDRLDIPTPSGDKLRIERVEATPANRLPRGGGYCITIWTGGPAAARWVSIPRFGAPRAPGADSLVEFLGYPQEVPPEREKLEAMERDRDVARRELALLNRQHLDVLDERTEIVAQVEALLRSLKDAWWLEAASAYRQLAHRLGIHG